MGHSFLLKSTFQEPNTPWGTPISPPPPPRPSSLWKNAPVTNDLSPSRPVYAAVHLGMLIPHCLVPAFQLCLLRLTDFAQAASPGRSKSGSHGFLVMLLGPPLETSGAVVNMYLPVCLTWLRVPRGQGPWRPHDTNTLCTPLWTLVFAEWMQLLSLV